MHPADPVRSRGWPRPVSHASIHGACPATTVSPRLAGPRLSLPLSPRRRRGSGPASVSWSVNDARSWQQVPSACFRAPLRRHSPVRARVPSTLAQRHRQSWWARSGRPADSARRSARTLAAAAGGIANGVDVGGRQRRGGGRRQGRRQASRECTVGPPPQQQQQAARQLASHPAAHRWWSSASRCPKPPLSGPEAAIRGKGRAGGRAGGQNGAWLDLLCCCS
jgi:hypothetical protein